MANRGILLHLNGEVMHIPLLLQKNTEKIKKGDKDNEIKF